MVTIFMIDICGKQKEETLFDVPSIHTHLAFLFREKFNQALLYVVTDMPIE